MKPHFTRLAFGLIALVSIDIILYATIGAVFLSQIHDLSSFFVWMVATNFAVLFLATTVGGYIARTKFAIPAMIYAGADFFYGIYRGSRLASKSGPINFSELDYSFAPWALLGLLSVLVIAASGSVTGMKLVSATYLRDAGPAEGGA